MGRPKLDANQPSAKERIIESFWKCLGSHPYTELTISLICRTANLSHNTLYYHFANIDDIASYAFDQTITPKLAEQIFTILNAQDDTEDSQPDPDYHERLRRTMLWISNSPDNLREVCVKRLTNHWLASVGKSIDVLTEYELAELRFIVGGMTFALQSKFLQGHPEQLASVLALHFAPTIYQAFVDMLISDPVSPAAKAQEG